MNTFNRVVMSLLGLLLLAAACVALLVLTGALEPGALPGGLGPLASDLEEVSGDERLLAFLVTLATAAVALALLYFELFRRSRNGKVFLVSDSEAGQLTVEREGVCRLAEREARAADGVVAARAQAFPDRGGVSFGCTVTVSSGTVVTGVGDVVQKRVRAAVEREIGLTVHVVRVRIRIGREDRSSSAAPPPPPPPAPERERSE